MRAIQGLDLAQGLRMGGSAGGGASGGASSAGMLSNLGDALSGLGTGGGPGMNPSHDHGAGGYLSRVARVMHDGRGAEIAARSGGGGSGGGWLETLARLAPTAETPDLRDSPRRQLRRLGLGMMAHSGPEGWGLSGIGQAGLDAMGRNDKARLTEIEHAQAQREALREHAFDLHDRHLDEREFRADRADARADRQLERRRYESLDEYRRRQADTAARRADAYATKVGRGSATEREISDLISRGVPPGWAQDVARGNVKTETDDFGNIRAVNIATGEVRNLSGQQGSRGAEAGAKVPGQNAGRGQRGQGDVFGAVEEGTGPIAGLRAATNAVVGPFIEGTPFENTARARAGLRNFAQEAKTALVNNPRFPVAEQQIVQELMPDPGRFWVDPDAERDKLRELRSFLQNKISQNRRSMSSGQVTQDEHGRLANQIESIERVLGLMGSPDQAGGGQLPEGVPQGSRKIGTLNGQPVYETPDGKRLVAE